MATVCGGVHFAIRLSHSSTAIDFTWAVNPVENVVLATSLEALGVASDLLDVGFSTFRAL